MIVHVPDKLFQIIGTEEGVNKILERFTTLNMDGDSIVLNKDHRKKLQLLFDCIIANGDELIAKVTKLNGVSIAGSQYTFSAEQLSRIKDQADFYGKKPKEYIQEIVSNYMGQMMGEV